MSDRQKLNNRDRRRTLSDVARAANVSEMTVSRVLNGKTAVSEKTRQHVLTVVDELGYVANRLAGSLATSRSNQVAVIIPSLGNNVFTAVTSGITDQLERAGYNAVMGISEYDPQREERILKSMMSWRPAGIILTGQNRSPACRNILLNASVPVVELMEIVDDPIDIVVGLKHDDASAALTEYLIRKGYRRFGFIGFRDDSSVQRRLGGIRTALHRNAIAPPRTVLSERPQDMELGQHGLQQLLKCSEPPDVVMFSNDTAAVGGMMHCLKQGIDVPGKVAIAGFSGLQSGQLLPKKLTTIATNRFDIGRLGAKAIINRLDGQPVGPVHDLGFELIDGETA